VNRRARAIWVGAAGLAAIMLAAAIGAILVLRSGWLREKVRQRIVAEVEKATGGRSEIGGFQFDWKRMRAEVDGFVLHGSEPPGAPPLFRADSIVAGLKIVSLVERAVDVQYLDVRRPQVYLVLYPDGRTNVPEPKAKPAGKGTVAAILDLAVGRFGVQEGSFEVEGRGRTPFSAQGRDLRAQFTYDKAGPRYRGRVSVARAEFQGGGFRPAPLDVQLELAVERDRIQIDSARVATAQSQAEFSGAIDSITAWSGSFAYRARLSLAEVNRTLAARPQMAGPVALAGNIRFRGAADYMASGTLHAAGLWFQPDAHFILRNFNADGAVQIDPRRVEVTGLRLSGLGMAALTGTGHSLEPIPLAGRMETVVLRQKTLDATGIRLDMMGGSFEGRAQLADFKRVRVEGGVAGFDARHMMRVYNGQSVPWDGTASGPVDLSVWLGRPSTLHLRAQMSIAPAAAGAPVHGAIDATYDGASETLDLARSFLALPSTRVDFNGVLGQRLRVHAASRDLDDVLPAFEAQSLPVKLQNGEAHFDGEVSGKLDDPHIAGHVNATNAVWNGRAFEALSGDVGLSSSEIGVRNGSVQSGMLRVRGSGTLGMRDWSVEDASAISAAGSIHNAPAAELLKIAGGKDVRVAGAIDADGKISGTASDPRIAAKFTATNGAIDDEPFDRLTGAASYSGRTVEMAQAQLAAGNKQVTFEARYDHQPGSFGNGRLSFQVDSNAMPLNQFQMARREYPGIHGTAEVHAAGLVEIAPAKRGDPGFRVTTLNGTLHASGLRLNDQPLRDVTLTAATKSGDLVAHFDSELAGSTIQGDGKWRLADDYPGSAQVGFKGLDLTRLRAWLAGGNLPGGLQLVGSAEGTLTISGPAIKPDLWKAELRIPTLRIGPGGDLAAKGAGLALHNSAPVVIALEHGVAKVESARLVGRATDLSLTGTIRLQQKNPLDLHVSGRFDLASLADFNRDIFGAGSIETGVTIRGTLAQPLVNGRLDIKDATVNLADIPVGVYKANGVILFDSSRATIQSFSGESGGGQVSVTGFAGYSGDGLVFRLHATAHEMRVRFPEDFSTVANASLNLTGASDSSTLSGRITVLRTGFNPRSDFSSVLAKSAEPVRAPSAPTGLLGNMHFDVQIDTAPDITLESSLAQGLQAEASLRLRGTGSNPSLLGRINVTQGQIVFFGTQFTINEGSIAFYNPVKIDPVLNVDLETKARGISVILNISGPVNKLNLTPRSDPPMPLADILALLATGRSPTSDYSTLMASPASPQSLQQLGASALLGQAIASPVTGRLQRFFGVTRLKIDPTMTNLTGAVNSAQARLTVEQQVTPDITFTYITDVTSTNPLVVQVEWAFSRKWSAVLLREENGLLGLNFVYKRRFK